MRQHSACFFARRGYRCAYQKIFKGDAYSRNYGMLRLEKKEGKLLSRRVGRIAENWGSSQFASENNNLEMIKVLLT